MGAGIPIQKATLGRVVVYVMTDDESARVDRERSARVSAPGDGITIDWLHVDSLPGDVKQPIHTVGNVSYDSQGAPGTWHWPPRV